MKSRPLQLTSVGLVILVAVFILMVKDKPQAAATGSSSALPQAQLDRAIQAGKPALAFYHSNSCDQCIIMVDIVEQVYPEFSKTVALVDVNVYDPENEALLRSARIQFIPTLVFYNAQGQADTHVGVMEASALQTRLSELGGAQ